MRIAVIGDRHTVLGFSLAGVEGAEPGSDPRETLLNYMDQEDLGVLIITSGVADLLRKDIEHLKKERNFPIVVEIPEHGKEITVDRINDLLKKAVGMDIKT
jgi:vacuolar-type H+-ATPase subunit F/Vma7